MANYWYGDEKDPSTLTKFQESWKYAKTELMHVYTGDHRTGTIIFIIILL